MSTPRNTAHATVGGPPPSGTSTAGRTARLIGRRLLGLVVSLAVSSIIIFALLSLLPGDVAQVMLGSNADPKMAAQLREQLGLDDPFFVRYWHWLSGLLTGDLGTSVLSGQEIAPQIAERLAVTGWLVLLEVVTTVGTLVAAVGLELPPIVTDPMHLIADAAVYATGEILRARTEAPRGYTAQAQRERSERAAAAARGGFAQEQRGARRRIDFVAVVRFNDFDIDRITKYFCCEFQKFD